MRQLQEQQISGRGLCGVHSGQAEVFLEWRPAYQSQSPKTPSLSPFDSKNMLRAAAGEYPNRGALRALCVPEECPQEVADLFLECIDEEPASRPTAKELVQRLTELQRLGRRGTPPRQHLSSSA